MNNNLLDLSVVYKYNVTEVRKKRTRNLKYNFRYYHFLISFNTYVQEAHVYYYVVATIETFESDIISFEEKI